MKSATFKKHTLVFKKPGGTSRGTLKLKETYLLFVNESGKIGIGECGLFKGLSADDRPDYESTLRWLCDNINKPVEVLWQRLLDFPSIQFGMEQALLSLNSATEFELFPSAFTKGKAAIPINGLIWMGSVNFMQEQIAEKLKAGFDTIKMKIGAIDFEAEIELLTQIRKSFSKNEIVLRVDANGAFTAEEAMHKLERLSLLDIHSIEQPLKAGQWEAMHDLCEKTPIPIALDEELIGIFDVTKKKELLHIINPQFIILKPSLIGGFRGSEEWIKFADEQGVGWWVTSALESNIGLNAIAQWTYTLNSNRAQGLGTGSLFSNNIKSPLKVIKGELYYDPKLSWEQNINLITA